MVGYLSPTSPSHVALHGTFSPEDIQELLGAMGDHRPTVEASPGDELQPAATASNGADAPLQDGEDEDAAKAQARSERKRSREKQRRSDVNRQFADLTQTLQKIEQEDEESNRMKFSASNRVDLIAKTICLLERLHNSNKRQKTDIQSLEEQLAAAKKAGEQAAAQLKEAQKQPTTASAAPGKQIMMMVPMMMPSDAMQGSAAIPTPAPMMMMNPFGMQQAFCPPQPIPTAAATAANHTQTAAFASMPPGNQMQFPMYFQAPSPSGSPAPTGAGDATKNNMTFSMLYNNSQGAANKSPSLSSVSSEVGQQSKVPSAMGGGNLAHCA